MNQQANLLRQAVESKKQRLIDGLIDQGVTKVPDGRQLYELTLSELQHEYNEVIKWHGRIKQNSF